MTVALSDDDVRYLQSKCQIQAGLSAVVERSENSWHHRIQSRDYERSFEAGFGMVVFTVKSGDSLRGQD